MKRNHGQNEELPPHAGEAEGALLGCILLAASDGGEGRKVWELVDGRIGQEVAAFFILANREVFLAMRGLVGEGMGLDVVLLTQRLRDSGKLEGCGGAGYVSGLPELAPAASMAGEYLALVWNKYLARRMIQGGIELASGLQALGGFNDGVVARFVERVEGLRRAAGAGEEAGKLIRKPQDYGEGVYNLWFGREKGEPGKRLPPDGFGDFPFKFRGSEFTWCVGDSGAGKSTMLQYILLHLMGQGTPVLIASMEMRPAVTLRMLVKQLLGTGSLPDNAWGHGRLASAMGWLQDRLLIYNFLGIADWRELVPAMTEVAKGLKERDGGKDEIGEPRVAVLVDNVMRLGIPEDDLAQESACAQRLTTWVQEWNAHLMMVSHTTKGEGSLKQRSRGSKRWTDASHNIFEIERNEVKGQKMDDLRQQLKEGKIDQGVYEKDIKEWIGKWDGRLTLHKQRLDGSRQNGRRYLFFEAESLQFSDERREKGADWLERWK